MSLDDNINSRDNKKTKFEELVKQNEFNKKMIEETKKEIENKIHERDLFNNNNVTAEEKHIAAVHLEHQLKNDTLKLKFKLQSFKAEADRLNTTVRKLENEKEKYGSEASMANADYYQCLEQVKIKNNIIQKL